MLRRSRRLALCESFRCLRWGRLEDELDLDVELEEAPLLEEEPVAGPSELESPSPRLSIGGIGPRGFSAFLGRLLFPRLNSAIVRTPRVAVPR